MRPDVIVVASVSCIYGLGSPDEYRDRILGLKVGEEHEQRGLLRRLVDLQYDRNDMNLVRGTFRARGDTVEIHPAYEETALRVEILRRHRRADRALRRADRRDGRGAGRRGRVRRHPLRGRRRDHPAGHQLDRGRAAGALVRSSRRRASCSRPNASGSAPSTTSRCWPRPGSARGSRTTAGTSTDAGPGETPFTLLDFFPKDFLVVVDESHVAVPQLHGQFAGDRHARTSWSSTASGSPRRSTTDPCASRSSSSGSPRPSSSRPPRARTSWSSRPRSSSR